MRWRIPLLLTLVAFVAVSCDQQPAAPVSDQVVAEAPAFNWMNNDGWHGKTFRASSNYGWVGWDVEGELIATMMTHDWFCEIGEMIEPVSVQWVYNNPDVADEIYHKLFKGELHVELYDWTGEWSPWDCANWTEARHMGTGTCTLVATDNDVDAWLGGHPNANSYGAKCNGKIELDGGGMTNMNYHFHHTWNPDKELDNMKETLKLSNDPR